MKTTTWSRIVGVTLGALALTASAQAPDLSGPQSTRRAAAPQTQNGVQYLTGGVGESEQALLGAAGSAGYNLQLVFAEKGTGAFLSDVHVIVADASGRVLVDTVTNGPAFFAKVPAGSYRVTAESKGARQVQTIHADAGGRRVTMTWPAEPGSAAQ